MLRRCALLALIGLAASVADASPKRAKPDYDGRGNPDTEAGSWVLWIPRVVMSPFYLVNDYVLRRPLGALVKRAERRRWVNDVAGLFKFGKGGKSVTVPIALFDLGLLPRVGVYYASIDLFADGNEVSVQAANWGARVNNVTVRDRYTWKSTGTSLAARGDFLREKDFLYLGLGPDVTEATRSRYGLQKFDGGLVLRQPASAEGSITLATGVRAVSFREGDCCGDPSLDTRIMAAELARPPGYGTSYKTLYQRLEVMLDTRVPQPAAGTGAFLEMHAETSFDVTNDRSWLELGGAAGFAIDLNRRHRTISAQVAVDYVDPISGDTVPFTELASPSPSQMPGFIQGWMTGRSMFAAQLGYSWPVYGGLDAQTHVSTGNAFGGHLAGLAADKLRMSWDIGIATTGRRDQGFELLVGLGTTTFEQGADITSVRVSFGSRRAF
ncbi:MAG: hypothetical protein ABI175_02630 [Polyangiales bacterium]